MSNSLFKIVYFVEFIVIVLVRKIYSTKYREAKIVST